MLPEKIEYVEDTTHMYLDHPMASIAQYLCFSCEYQAELTDIGWGMD